MAFEVRPTRVVSKRTRWTALPVVIAALAIVAIAVASKAPPESPLPGVTAPRPTPSATSGGRAAGQSSPSLALLPTAVPSITAGPDGRPGRTSDSPIGPGQRLPRALTCTALDKGTCASIAEAAIRIVPADWPRISRASVWRSLLCDSTLDCPPALLRSVVPLGSVVLDLVDHGPPIWINVVGWRTLTESSAGLQLQAWIVRS